MIVMGKTDPEQSPHRQQSMILVPMDTPGVENVRPLPVFGYQDQHGHNELRFTTCGCPRATSSPVRATAS
jgi:acyl-CoA dehydrogenase